MSILKKLAGQTAIYGLSSIVGRLLNYLLVPIYTRVFLDTAEYGVVTEMYAYAGFFIVIFTYGMETAFFRFESKDDRQKVFSTSFISILITSILLSAVMILNSESLARMLTLNSDTASSLGASSYNSYIIWFALIFSFDAISAIPFAKLRAENRATRFAVIKLLNIGINILLNIYFILIAPEISAKYGTSNFWVPDTAQVSYIFFSNLVASAVTIFLLFPDVSKVQWSFDKVLWRRMIIYALPLMIVGFAGAINEMLDRVLLKFLLPYSYEKNMAALGVYGACYKLSILMTLFTQAYRYAADPFYFSQSEKKDAKTNYADAMKYFVIVGCLIFLGVMLFIDVMKHFIGKEYHGGLHVVPILLMANLALGIYYNLSIWYKLKDKTMIGAYISIGGAIITVALNFWLIPVMGYVGAAWTTLVCYVLMTLISYILGQKNYSVPYAVGRILMYISVSLLLYWTHQYIKTSLTELGSSIHLLSFLFVAIFLAMVWRLERGNLQSKSSNDFTKVG